MTPTFRGKGGRGRNFRDNSYLTYSSYHAFTLISTPQTYEIGWLNYLCNILSPTGQKVGVKKFSACTSNLYSSTSTSTTCLCMVMATMSVILSTLGKTSVIITVIYRKNIKFWGWSDGTWPHNAIFDFRYRTFFHLNIRSLHIAHTIR